MASAIEHIVLFKVKPETDDSKIAAMVNGLNGLASLDTVLSITAGPLLRNRSSAFVFTHMLHSRYRSKEDLASYSQHPSHVSVVRDSVLPICDDVMAVDWIAEDLRGDVAPPPGSAVRVNFLKLKEDSSEEAKSEVLAAIKEVGEGLGQIRQLSAGENFSPGRAKGFSIASLAVFDGPGDLEGLESSEEFVNSKKDKVRNYLESVIVVDYLVSSPQFASL